MYRNCVYDNKTKSIHLWTWDSDGNRVKQQLDFKPYLYLEDKKGNERSIYGTQLKKKEFETLWDRNKFVKETNTKRLFENLPPYQQFLIDNYYHCCGDDNFSEHPLKVMFLDIECPGAPGGKFPEPELAENVINLLTCYDSLKQEYTTFGLEPYVPTQKNVNYVFCKSEKDLLRKFIRHFSSDYPDCLVGYNCVEENQHVWMDDRIVKIKNLSNLNKNNPLKMYGGRLNKHMATGKKRAYKITDMMGRSVVSSNDHRYILHRKKKEEYKYLSSLTKYKHDITIEEMLANFNTDDFYCRLHIGDNQNSNYMIKDYIIDNFEYLKNSQWFNFQITSEAIRDRLKGIDEVKNLINIDSYWWGKTFWKRSHKWSFQYLKEFLTDEEVKTQIKESDVLIYCKKLNRTSIDINKPISNKIMQLLGYMFTDGTYDKHSDVFSISSKHRELLHSYVDIINSELDKELTGSKPTSHNGVKHKSFVYNNLIGLLLPIIYDGDKKHPNMEILSRMSREQFIHFFSGMMDGDGYVTTGGINVCNFDCVKFNFLNDLSELLFWNGIPSRTYKNYINIPSWDININNISDIKAIMLNNDRISKFEKIKWKTLENSPAKVKSYFYDSIKNDLVVKIKKIEDLGYDVDMYDIETTDHSFLCNGMLVHNCNNFDIPYIINRITNVLGKEWADDLSPIGRIYEKVNQDGKFGMPVKQYVIEGISSLDYYVLYMKFAMEPLESYKLDYVAEVELGENKVDYDGSLADLAINDWNKYVDYNLKDVEILVRLDEKLRYIELLRFISYLGLCNMENAVRTVPVINGAVAIRARNRDEKIPTFIRPRVEGKIPGGYVAEPKLGFVKALVSFDANSLYPSVMISLNMSPETKVGSVEKIEDKYNFTHVSGRMFELTKEKYLKMIKDEKLAKSEANILFSQKRKGLMPEFLDFLYSKRKEMKSKMVQMKRQYQEVKSTLNDSEKTEWEKNIQRFDTFQHAYKITLNSTYGYCANKYAPLGDDEIGTSVTLTGQAIIKQSNEIFKNFIKTKYSDVYDSCEKYLIYNDTDSVYLSLKLLEHYNISLSNTDGGISPEFLSVCREFEDYLNSESEKWVKRKFWSLDPRIVFKREAICDQGIFVGGKNYVLHVLDDEGVSVDKFKYKGLAVVKSTMPKDLKPYVKKIIETMVRSQDLNETNEAFKEAYEAFKKLDVKSIYKNSSMNNYEEYVSKCKGFTTVKGMPAHLKAAHYHDLVVEKLGLDKKYQKFRSGDKVKSVYLKTPNKYGIDMIGFKGNYPKEFEEIFEVDYEKMFGKILYAAIETIYDVVNWRLRKPNENVKLELENFLK